MNHPTRILMVCTGNICRSPTMHYLAAQEWGSAALVTSAGTHAETGMDVPTPMRRSASAAGLTIPSHRPTQLNAELIDQSDLVLVATQSHLTWIADELGRVPSHVFGFKQATDLALRAARPPGDSPAERLASAAATLRTQNDIAPAPLRSLDDPWSRDQATYDRVYGEISDGISILTSWAGLRD
ncbi:hypothetical protein [Demequina aurantiaca]|uniref:arsenate reductase/protein-tyrosine-phosphatase family protein n=1 Tax=Demequina aurantiaca TaxID=676200 RepID=UPI003D3458F4